MSDIDMIRAAAGRLEGHARRTPLLSSPFLDEIAGRRVLVKPATPSSKPSQGTSQGTSQGASLRAVGVQSWVSDSNPAPLGRRASSPAATVLPETPVTPILSDNA